MKSIWERRNVINGIRMAFFTMLIIVGLSWGSKSKSKDTLYILFEKDKPLMNISSDANYKFWVNEEEFFLFEPKDKYRLSKQIEIKEKIVDIEWLSNVYKVESEKIKKCPNIYIVEKIGIDSVSITPVKVYEGTE